MTITVPNPQDLQGQVLYDSTGQEIGLIDGIYLDTETRRPEWAAVRLGPDAIALVPLSDAVPAQGGARVAFDLEMVLDAPFQLTALDNEVTEETERLLYGYYAGSGGAGAVEEAREVAATVKDEASDVAASAKAQAGEVVATAHEQAATVVERAKEETAEVAEVVSAEVRDMVDTTRSELEVQAETQISQIAENMHRLAGQALALARGNADQAGQLGEVVGRAGEELQSVAAGIEQRGSAGLLSDAQRTVRQRPRAAVIGTAAAIVAGARLMGTPAGERLKKYVAPLKDQAIEAGRSMADELKPIAQQRAERVKTIASQAADQVKQDAQDTVEDVQSTTTRSTQTVKGTARRSAATVKGTARQSTGTVKTTAKRKARAATPVG